MGFMSYFVTTSLRAKFHLVAIQNKILQACSKARFLAIKFGNNSLDYWLS